MPSQKLAAFTNHGNVFFKADSQYLGCVVIPGLAHQSDARRLGPNKGLHSGIILGLHRLAAGHPKCAYLSLSQIVLTNLLKEGYILFIRKRISALDEVDAGFSQSPCDIQLVL